MIYIITGMGIIVFLFGAGGMVNGVGRVRTLRNIPIVERTGNWPIDYNWIQFQLVISYLAALGGLIAMFHWAEF